MRMLFIATCKMGLESTVSRQLRTMGIDVQKTQDARVYFSGDFDTMARALLWLRTAERVLLVVGSFSAESFDALYEGTKALQWKPYLSPKTRIHVNGKSAKSALFSVSDCQSIVKKAIVDNLKTAYRTDVIPETDEEVIVEVGMLRNEATLTLDCCGAGLSRRGYRTYNVDAPLSETLGAGIVMLSRFRPDMPLVDPMCGSGTMPIEAAMIAQNRAPSLGRSFAAERWRFVPANVFADARAEALDMANHEPVQIEGSDMDARCIDLCKKHAKNAGVMLKWNVRPLKELPRLAGAGVLVCNPPYGERMFRDKEVQKLYHQMRDVFDALDAWQINVITAYRDFERIYGKHADRRRKLSNGGMACTLYQFWNPSPDKNDPTEIL